MLVDFNSVFHPTRKQKLERYEKALDMHKKNIGKCSTCGFYISPDYGGFYGDLGECVKKDSIFDIKIHSTDNVDCSDYVENKAYADLLLEKIRELGGRSIEK